MYACTLQNCSCCLRWMRQQWLKYHPGKARFLALKPISIKLDRTKHVPKSKKWWNRKEGVVWKESNKFIRRSLLKKTKALALKRGYIIDF